MTAAVRRIAAFLAVGGTGFIVDAGLLAWLNGGLGVDPFSARAVAIVAAALTTWRLNRTLTFGPSAHGQAGEGLRYFLVAGAVALFNYGLYSAGIAIGGLHPLAAMALATLLATALSYGAYRRLVFAGGNSAGNA